MRCGTCGIEIPSGKYKFPEHYFSGYGYAIQYCDKCCPIEFDERVCTGQHPNPIEVLDITEADSMYRETIVSKI